MIEALAALSGVAGALKSASEITKTLLETKDAAVVRAKVIELSGQIMTAQSSALSAQADQSALLKRVSDLEAEIANMEAWKAEKVRYDLKAVASGAYAYALKKLMSGGEPPHWLCARCYTQGKKSFLQISAGLDHGPWSHEKRWFCTACQTGIQVPYTTLPEYAMSENDNART